MQLISKGSGDISGSLKPESITGKIEFKNVSFSYPSKKEHLVLNDVNFII